MRSLTGTDTIELPQVLDSDDIYREDLVRWTHCTRRVRHLVLSHTEKSLLGAPFVPFFLRCAMRALPGPKPLLPLLQTIAFKETSEGVAPSELLRTCLSPTLSSVTVMSKIPIHFGVHIDSDLRMLLMFCDNVERITIMGHNLLLYNPPFTRFRRLRAVDLELVAWEESRPLIS